MGGIDHDIAAEIPAHRAARSLGGIGGAEYGADAVHRIFAFKDQHQSLGLIGRIPFRFRTAVGTAARHEFDDPEKLVIGKRIADGIFQQGIRGFGRIQFKGGRQFFARTGGDLGREFVPESLLHRSVEGQGIVDAHTVEFAADQSQSGPVEQFEDGPRTGGGNTPVFGFDHDQGLFIAIGFAIGVFHHIGTAGADPGKECCHGGCRTGISGSQHRRFKKERFTIGIDDPVAECAAERSGVIETATRRIGGAFHGVFAGEQQQHGGPAPAVGRRSEFLPDIIRQTAASAGEEPGQFIGFRGGQGQDARPGQFQAGAGKGPRKQKPGGTFFHHAGGEDQTTGGFGHSEILLFYSGCFGFGSQNPAGNIARRRGFSLTGFAFIQKRW